MHRYRRGAPPQQLGTPAGPLDSLFDQAGDALGVGEIGNPKTPPARFFFVSRSDTPTRRSDLLFRLILRNLVQQPMIRHHQMRPLTHPDPPLDGDTASLQAVVLFDEAESVDYHTVAQETTLSRVEDPRGNLVQNEFILSDMDGVPGVGPALVTGHHMHVLGEDIDNLALPLITPLATQHHRAVAGISTFRHGVNPP